MSTLLLGSNYAGEAPSDEGDVRSTITVVDHDSPTAVAETSPEFNTAERDPDTEGGLTTRQVADKVNPSEQYPRPVSNANTDFAAPINSQVSTSGTAAEREESGQWGHGTMQWSEALEPVYREGAAFDNIYFSARRSPIQDGAPDSMRPARPASDSVAAHDKAAAAEAARKAATANLYAQFTAERLS